MFRADFLRLSDRGSDYAGGDGSFFLRSTYVDGLSGFGGSAGRNLGDFGAWRENLLRNLQIVSGKGPFSVAGCGLAGGSRTIS
jgi:hypothetical protein